MRWPWGIIDVDAVNFDDRALMALWKLPELRHLRLRRCPITDEALHSLSQIKRLREPVLEELDLSNTEVSDRGLVELDALPSLKLLNLYGTRVTPAGGLAFQKVSWFSVIWKNRLVELASKGRKRGHVGCIVQGSEREATGSSSLLFGCGLAKVGKGMFSRSQRSRAAS